MQVQHEAHVSVNGTNEMTACLDEKEQNMAYAASHSASRPSIVEYFANLVASVKEASARRAVYVKTLGELRSLSDRELADLGIARLQIEDIALQAAYAK